MHEEEYFILPKEVISEWTKSRDGHLVHRALRHIRDWQHGSVGQIEIGEDDDPETRLASWPIYDSETRAEIEASLVRGENPDARLLQPERIKKIVDLLPIEDIHSAIYVVGWDELLLSHPYTFFLPPTIGSELDERFNRLNRRVPGMTWLETLVGFTATVKSNGWQIFDIRPGIHSWKPDLMRKGATELAKKRGIFLFQNFDTQYEPVFPINL